MITIRIEMTMATIGRLLTNLAMARVPGYLGWLRAGGAPPAGAGAGGTGVVGVITGWVPKVAAGSGSAGWGLTFSPCRTLSRPSTTIRSPGLSPFVTIQ